MFEIARFDDSIGPIRGTFAKVTEIVQTGFLPSEVAPADLRLDEVVALDTIHDGASIPAELGDLTPTAAAAFESVYADERDWGAHYVAQSLGRQLGLSGYLRVTLARPLLDFGRFAGIHETAIDPLTRYAICPPMSQHLDNHQKRLLLEQGYDEIFHSMAQWIEGKRIKLAIHTYRPSNQIGTRRPEVSLLLRSPSYDQHTDLRQTTLFELYPRDLVEFTADRILAYRMAMTLEQAFIPTGINSPYLLPDGAVEVRLQVWTFFQFVKRELEEAGACDAIGSPEYDAVWRMLCNTNRRSAEGAALLEQLHMGAQPWAGMTYDRDRLHSVYADVRHFLSERRAELVWRFRFRPERVSAMVVEIRRDAILRTEPDHNGNERPTGVDLSRVELIGSALASAVRAYLTEDLPLREQHFSQGSAGPH